MEPPKAVTTRLLEIPSKYRILKCLGRGVFGIVLKCLDKETGETVAIKIPRYRWIITKREIYILKKIKKFNLDKHNIVKYIECFKTSRGKAFVFESLDISLDEYMKRRNNAPMLLSDIRTIIQQMATALKALEEIELIHTDVKLDNIMMVDHLQRPFEVKLIDFGLAMYKSPDILGMTIQPRPIRAPEVIFGIHLSEAIDMWSLGCAMFQMLCGSLPFSGEDDYEIVLGIIELLGQPPYEFFRNSHLTHLFFNCSSNDFRTFTIKPPEEYYITHKTRTREKHQFKCLDDMKAMRLEENNLTEAIEREQCIELLRGMLSITSWWRFLPSEVLAHPFITQDYSNVQAHVLGTSSGHENCPSLGCRHLSHALRDISTIQPDCCTPPPKILPSGVILVRSATAENTALLENQESAASEPLAAPLKDEDSSTIQPDGTDTGTKKKGKKEKNCFQRVLSRLRKKFSCRVSPLQPDGCTPSLEIQPSGVILVQPAIAENTTLLEDQESAVSFSVLNKTSKSSVSDADDNTKISEDSTTCEDTGTKKKGKKNCFQRVLSRLRKKFSCRVSPID